MKNLIFISVLVLCFVKGFSQADTLFTGKGKKIPCKIYEINEFEIKYRRASALDGPIYVVDKTTILRYTLSNGYTERLMPDEMSLQNEHKEILGNRSVIKIHPFSFAFNHVSFAYEQVIKVGMNLDVEVGYINTSITSNSIFGDKNTVGAYLKPGLKFFLGQDFSTRGLKYAHPLKGRYIKIDLALAYLNVQNIETTLYGSYNPSVAPTYTTVMTDINSVSYGGFINYGRQYILGNLFTLDYYAGIGFTAQSNGYTNANYLSLIKQNNSNGNYAYDASRNISNYYGFVRIPSFGLAFTCGLRLGFIIPSKKDSKRKTAVNVN
jgi:hypothetical protein